jgi:hypothetical protein
MTGALLGHTDQNSTKIYSHLQHGPSLIVADRVAAKIAAALEGTTARIIPLRSRSRRV